MDRLISVIIPIYGVEKFLPKCIDTVLEQTYKCFELILVDDGSPDNSGKICDEYAEKDSRIKVIHKPNGGVSSARNAGINVMKGEFVTFIDPDDYIHPQMLEILLSLIDEYDADISLCFSRGTHKRDYEEPDAEKYNIKALTGKETLEKLYSGDFMDFFGFHPTAIYNKLYKTSIFGNDLRFNEKARMAEDLTIIPYIFDKAENLYHDKHRYTHQYISLYHN